MADLTLSTTVQYSKNGRSFVEATGGVTSTLDGDSFNSGTMTATQLAKKIPLGDIAIPGYAIVRNLSDSNLYLGYRTPGESSSSESSEPSSDSTSSQSVYSDLDFTNVMTIPAGQFVVISLDGLLDTPYVIADDDVILSYTIFDK